MARKSKKNKPLPEDEPPLAEPGEPSAAEDAELLEIAPEDADEIKSGEPPPEGMEPAAQEEPTAPKESAPLEEPEPIPDITNQDTADETRTPEEGEEPGPALPPYEPAPLIREPLVKPGTLLFLALIIGGGGLLFYQNLEVARSNAELKESLAKIESRIESITSEKMDEKSGVLIAQAVKTLKEDVRILKERVEQPGPPTQAAKTQRIDAQEPDAPVSEIAVDPRLLEGEPEDEGESEEQAGAEEAQQVADVTPPAGEETEDHAPAPENEEGGEESGKVEAPPEVAEEEPEPAVAEAEAPEDEAGEEEPEHALARPEEAEEEPEVASPAEAPVAEQAGRTPVIRDYLNFIEESARKVGHLLQSGIDRLREAFSG